MRPPATRKTSSEVYFICQNNFMGDEIDAASQPNAAKEVGEKEEEKEHEFEALQRKLSEEDALKSSEASRASERSQP